MVEIFVVSGGGYHGGVVGGETELWDVDFPAIAAGVVVEGVAEAVVGGDAACHGYFLYSCVFDCLTEFFHEDFDYGVFEGGGEVFEVVGDEVGVFFYPVAHFVEEGGLKAAEAYVVAGDVGAGEFEFLGVAFSGKAVDDGAAGVAQAHDFGAFVDGFARGVVDGLAEDCHLVVGFDFDYLGVAA